MKRWERSRSLPVHRIPGGERGKVFAYTAELTQWLNMPLAGSDIPAQAFNASPIPSNPSELNIPAEATIEPASPGLENSKPWLTRALVSAGIAVATAFIIHLFPVHLHGVASRPITNHLSHTQNAEAEELYLRGRHY